MFGSRFLCAQAPANDPMADWLFPPDSVKEFAETIRAAGVHADYHEMVSDHGHDAFLAEQAELLRLLQ